MKIVRRLMTTTMIIGIFAIVLLWAFQIQNTLIEIINVNGFQIYKLNINNYITNINNTWNDFPLSFETILPPREFNDDIGNNLLALFDWLYFPINLVLWVIRLAAWIIKLLLAVIGFETTMVNGAYRNGIVEIISWLITNLMIPYV